MVLECFRVYKGLLQNSTVFLLFDRGQTAVEQKKPLAGDRRLRFEAAPNI